MSVTENQELGAFGAGQKSPALQLCLAARDAVPVSPCPEHSWICVFEPSLTSSCASMQRAGFGCALPRAGGSAGTPAHPAQLCQGTAQLQGTQSPKAQLLESSPVQPQEWLRNSWVSIRLADGSPQAPLGMGAVLALQDGGPREGQCHSCPRTPAPRAPEESLTNSNFNEPA